MQDRRITIRELAYEAGVSIGSVHSIVTEDLGVRISATFVPKLLTIEQKQLRLEIAQDMLETVNSDPNFFNTVISLAMRPGFMGTTQKPSSSHHNGSIQHPRSQK